MAVDSARYNYRLRPGSGAVRALEAEWDRCRWLWNQLVENSKARHQEDPTSTFGYAAQDKMLTQARAEHSWLADGSSVAQQQLVRDFAAARTKALLDRKNKTPVRQRRGLPRFKSKHRALPSLNYTRRGFSLKTGQDNSTRLHLAGGITIPVVWSRALPADPSSVRIYRDSLGHWYASFVVAAEPELLPPTPESAPLGIDWGVPVIATTTDDRYDLPHPQHGRKNAAALVTAQRKMARRKTHKGQPNTRGYERAKREAARAHKKVARQRADDARKWAKKVVSDHDRIAVEDFKPKFMTKNRSLARKAADGRIAATKHELIHQATKHGRDLRLIHPRWTTMDCSECGARAKHRLPLSERTYICENCGTVKPRDKNSAAVMVARAGFDPADVEGSKTRDPAVGPQAA